jgi:hypothetical protein
MKKIPAVICALLLFSFSPVYCDYLQLKDDFTSYEPPGDFLAPSDGGHDGKKSAPDVLSIEQEDLSTLKDGYGVRLANIGIDNVDFKTYRNIQKIARDNEALVNIIRQRVRLEEIKAMALLRNPAIEASRKKVLAEIQSFDQVTGLDDTLKQYSAFTRAVNTKVGPLKGKDSVKMAFPPPGLTALKGRIVESQVAVLLEKAAVTGKKRIKGH